MRTIVILLLFTLRCFGDWQIAQPGWNYRFPQDHGVHPDFKTEWWYFTGNVRDESGHEFGFQLTFFRQGIRPETDPGASRFIVRDLKFAHFAISDLRGQTFYFKQRTSRGAFGEAGFGGNGRLAWINDWQLTEAGDGSFEIVATSEGRNLKLHLTSVKQAIIHGENGVSQKATGEGHASQYYSLTRMKTEGELRVPGRSASVTGETWFDHEWATNQLTPEQAGWNWFSLQLADGSELMLYQMRLRDGGIDRNSSGTFVARTGATTHLRCEDFSLMPLAFWKSAATGVRYPMQWRLRIPSLQIDAEISTPLEKQELALPAFNYWEGAIRAAGISSGTRFEGRGYMELTGYGSPLSGLTAEP